MLSIDDLKKENNSLCDSEGCNLKALHAHQGQISKSRWISCIDCQLKDCAHWQSMEEFKDASDDMPFAIEMEQIVRNECTANSNVTLPSYLSGRSIDTPLVTAELNESPPLNDANNDSKSDDASDFCHSRRRFRLQP